MHRYEKYEDVDSYWYQEVPYHWKKTKNKYVFHQNKTVVGDSWENYVLLTMGKSGVKPRDMDGGGKFPSSFENYQIVEPDQLIFCLFDLDETPRTVGKSSEHGMITSAYDVFSTNNENDPQFWTYFYQMIDDHKGLRPYYTGLRKVVRSEIFMGIEVFSPPINEQKLISRYLDKKTKQIDSLIKKIQKKIELLKEQRISLINHCVTKGLDPNVEMKDSGIEWIGEIPKHWDIKKIKYLTDIDGFRSGPFGSTLITDQLSESGDWIVYSPDNLRTNDPINQLYVPENRKTELSKYSVRPGDILIPIVGSINNSMVVTTDHPTGIINQRLCRLSLDDSKINIWFVDFLIKNSPVIRTQIDVEKKGSILDHITKEIIFNLLIPYPPRHEQDDLFDHILNDTKKIDNLIERQDEKRKLLVEYRQSLISSVVTGKVRVTEDMI